MVAGEGSASGLAWLDDVLIVDVGDEANAAAAGLLAELGATVVRVEAATGDGLRAPEQRWAHATTNAGKVSLAVDFEDEATWAPVLAGADVVDAVIGPLDPAHGGHRLVAALESAGVGVVRSVFRRGRPDEVATDLIVGAAAGHLVLNGAPGRPPSHPAGDLADKQLSLAVAEATLALVLGRRRSGSSTPEASEGSVGSVVVSAQEAMALTTFQTANANHWHWHRRAPGRDAKLTDGTTVRSADGEWLSFTIHPPAWPKFVSWVAGVLGPRGVDGPEWLEPAHAAANRGVLYGVVAELAAALPIEELLAEGQARGLLVLPVYDLGDVAGDVHLAARDFWEPVGSPDGGARANGPTAGSATSALRLPGSAFRTDAGRGVRGPAPALGVGGAEALSAAAAIRSPSATGGSAALSSPSGDGVPWSQPLAGVRIVDFCWAIAGPLSTRLLADLGADVVKIESENGLDLIRYVGVQPPDGAGWDSCGVFQDTSANKRAVTINVDTEEGRELVRGLVAGADIVTSNYTPDRMDRWGLGAADLAAIKPDLITANMAVMGTSGPRSGWRSYGSGIVAMCGLAAHTGEPGRLPECLGTLHTDFTVPYYAATALMAALHHRDRTGDGVHLELAQYETAVRLLDAELAGVLNGEPVPERRGNASPTMAPHGVYPAEGDDRWVAIACRNEEDWARLVAVVDGLAGLDRWRDAAAVDEALARWTVGRSGWETAERLQAAGVPASPVEDLAELFGTDPMGASLWAEMELAAGMTGLVIQEPTLWAGERLPLRRAPGWFEHTFDVVVGELGVSPDRFADLVERRVLW